MQMLWSLRLHHGGLFSSGTDWRYVGGTENIAHNVDLDRMSLQEIFGWLRELGYNGPCRIFHQISRSNKCLMLLDTDEKVLGMFNTSNKGSEILDLYVEHNDGQNKELTETMDPSHIELVDGYIATQGSQVVFRGDEVVGERGMHIHECCLYLY